MNNTATPTYEKVETIVLSYLKNRTTEGSFGSITDYGNNVYTVQSDGYKFSVWTTPEGWCVRSGDMSGVDADLLGAARSLFA